MLLGDSGVVMGIVIKMRMVVSWMFCILFVRVIMVNGVSNLRVEDKGMGVMMGLMIY
jgi:hypothetical protein